MGNTQSFGSPYHASNGWVVKIDSRGGIAWQETFEGQDIYSVDSATDGGFVLAGTVGLSGKADGWVIKLDAAGNILWERAYETASNSGFNSIQHTLDGGYVATGSGLFLKLDSNGNILWQKSYGVGSSFSNSLHRTPDGGFIVSGRAGHSWLLNVDSNGDVMWR